MASSLLGTGGVEVFQVPQSRRVMVQEEDRDLLLKCLPTIPGATDLTLRRADGSALPPDLQFTVDPRQGITIRAVKSDQSGDYVCSVLVNATRQDSAVFSITVKKSQLHLNSTSV